MSKWQNAQPADVLRDMLAIRDAIAARPPMPVGIETHPGERTPLEELPRVEAVDLRPLWGALAIEANPDVPEGEYWIRKSDGSHERFRWDGLPVASSPDKGGGGH